MTPFTVLEMEMLSKLYAVCLVFSFSSGLFFTFAVELAFSLAKRFLHKRNREEAAE